MPDVGVLNIQIQDNSTQAAAGLDKLVSSLERVKNAVGAGFKLSGVAKQIEQIHNAVVNAIPEESIQRIERLANALITLKSVGSLGKSTKSIANVMQQFASTQQQMTDGFQDIQSQVQQTGEAIGNSLGGGFENVDSKIQSQIDELYWYKNTASGAADALKNIKAGFDNLRMGVSNLFQPLTNLVNQFWRLAKMRMLRAVIKQIAAGFKEGIENYYHYSQKIGGEFAPAMDSAATSLLQMKNSIGAAVAPLIMELIPYLKMAVDWFINLVNYANQFMALLRGQNTWSRATEKSAKAFDDVKKSAKGASSAVKDLLADWDELNIIQSESTSNGGAGSGTKKMQDYLGMFEEVSKFDNKIKKIFDFINDAFGDTKTLAAEVGAIILGWKISKEFAGTLGTLGGIVSAGGTMLVTWQLTETIDERYRETKDEGWLVKDALVNAVGSTLAGGIVAKVLGGTVGLITAGITLAVSAGITYGVSLTTEGDDEQAALNKLAAIKAALGTGALALGFGIVGGSGIFGLLAGLGTGAVMFTLSAAIEVIVQQVKKADQIAREAFAKTGEGGISVDEILAAVQKKFDEATAGYTVVVEAFKNVAVLKEDLGTAFGTIDSLTAVIRGEGKLTQQEADDFKKAWQTVFSAFEGITAASFDTVFKGLNESLKSENEEIRKQAKELRISLMMVQGNMTEAQAELKNEMTEISDKILGGTATEKERETYFKYLEEMANLESARYMSTFEEIINENKNIDFGDAEHAVENMNAYMDKVAEGEKEAIAKVDEGYKTELEALNELRRENEMLHNLNKINDDQYKTATALFDQMEETFAKTAEERKKSISKTVQDAYNQVLEQALSGLEMFRGEDGKNPDVLAAFEYMQDIVAEVVARILDEGGKIPEEISKAYDLGTGKGLLGLGDYVKSLYLFLMKKYGLDDIVDDMTDLNIEDIWEEPSVAGQVAPILETPSGESREEVWEAPIEIEDISAEPQGVEEAVEGIGENYRDAIIKDFQNTDWRNLSDIALQELVDTLVDIYGADEVRNAMEYLTYIPETDLINRLLGIEDTKPEDIKKAILDEMNAVDWTNLSDQAFAELIDCLAEVYGREPVLDILNGFDIPQDEIKKLLGLEDGPAEADLLVHVQFVDEDGEDLHIEDIWEEPNRGKLWNPSQVTARAGASSGVVYGSSEPVPVTMDPGQQQGSVQTGVRLGTTDIVTALNSLIQLAERINRKEFTVQITPTSNLGRVNARSKEKYGTITGW